MERLFQHRLDRMEADYAATIAAGERANSSRLEDSGEALFEPLVDSPDEPDDHHANLSTPECIPAEFTRNSPPLSEEEIASIKSHMASIRPSHCPSWAAGVSDEQLLGLLRKLSSE